MSDAKQPLTAPAGLPHEPVWHAFVGAPRTTLGWSAVVLAVVAIAFYGIAWVLVASGVGGGAYFNSPLPMLTLALADGASLAGGATGAAAILTKRERSLSVLLTVLLAVVTVVVLGGGILGP